MDIVLICHLIGFIEMHLFTNLISLVVLVTPLIRKLMTTVLLLSIRMKLLVLLQILVAIILVILTKIIKWITIFIIVSLSKHVAVIGIGHLLAIIKIISEKIVILVIS